MTRRTRTPAKPHARKKAVREKAVVAPIDPERAWADQIRTSLLEGCHPFQYDGAVDPAKRISFLVGRGGTKTTTLRVRGVVAVTSMPRIAVLYFAATRQRAKDLMWYPLKALLQKLNVEATFNETELRCTILRTGSMYMFAGLQDVADADKWRGQTFYEVQFDECGAIRSELLEYTVYQVIGPRVIRLVLGGTPGLRRRGMFYDVTRPGSDKHRPYRDRDKDEYADFEGYSSHYWTLEEVIALPGAQTKYPELVRLWTEALEEKKRNKWSDDNPIFLREYKAIWASDGTLRVFSTFRAHLADGTPWNVWDPFDGKEPIDGVAGLRIAVAKLRELHKDLTDWRYVVIMDMGHKDPFACSVFTFSPHDPDRNIWQAMSFERVGMYDKPIAELLLGADELDVYIKTGVFPTKYGGVFGVIGWPDALEMDSDHATLEALKNVYGVAIAKAEKKPEYKNGAIELVNGGFHDGKIKLLANGAAHQQCDQLQWKEQDNGKLVEDPAQANHSSDTVIYGRRRVAALFESGQVAQDEKSTAAVPYRDPMGLDPGIGTSDEAAEEEALLAPSEWTEDDEDW
jgi:hypothetical protein